MELNGEGPALKMIRSVIEGKIFSAKRSPSISLSFARCTLILDMNKTRSLKTVFRGKKISPESLDTSFTTHRKISMPLNSVLRLLVLLSRQWDPGFWIQNGIVKVEGSFMEQISNVFTTRKPTFNYFVFYPVNIHIESRTRLEASKPFWGQRNLPRVTGHILYNS